MKEKITQPILVDNTSYNEPPADVGSQYSSARPIMKILDVDWTMKMYNNKN